jgi:hypothetical protein
VRTFPNYRVYEPFGGLLESRTRCPAVAFQSRMTFPKNEKEHDMRKWTSHSHMQPDSNFLKFIKKDQILRDWIIFSTFFLLTGRKKQFFRTTNSIVQASSCPVCRIVAPAIRAGIDWTAIFRKA